MPRSGMGICMKIRINWFRHETFGAFEELRRHFLLLHAQIADASNIEKYILVTKPAPREVDYDDYLSELREHERHFGEVMPRILGFSFVVMLYSEVEFRFKGLCRKLQKERRLPLALNRFSGDIKEKTQGFLRAFGLPEIHDSEMKRLAELTLVRNCIVHNSGIVSGTEKERELLRIVEDSRGMTITQEYGNVKRLMLSNPYCLKHLDDCEAAFRRLFRELGYGPDGVIRD